MNFNLPQLELEDAILAAMPADEGALRSQLAAQYGARLVGQAFRSLLRAAQIEHDPEGHLELTAGARDRAAFRAAALDALGPVLDHWRGLLTEQQERQELIYAVEGRWRRSRKWCPRCKDQLLRSSFGIDSSRRDGLQAVCRACRREKRGR